MRESRRIFLVTTPEVVAIHLAQNRMHSLSDLGLADRVSLILNRKDYRSDHLEDSEVARLLEVPIAHCITNSYDNVQKAIIGGSPVPHSSEVGQSILDLARSLVADLPLREIAPSHRRRFLEFFHIPHPQEVGSAPWHD
jgi:Flp pilus assembly CpaE family ATPase